MLEICPECGSIVEFIETPFSNKKIKFCSVCDHKRNEQEKERERLRYAAEQDRRIKKAIIGIGIGKRFLGFTFADYKPTCQQAERILSNCKDYVANFEKFKRSGDGLILVGSVGTGKNMLAAIIAQEITKQGFISLHTTVLKLIRRIKQSWNKNTSETEEEAITRFVLPDLLILDEVGIQFGSETEKMLLTEVINDRYESMKPTVLISNISVKQLGDYLGQRIMDRFSSSQIFIFNWESYRKKAVIPLAS